MADIIDFNFFKHFGEILFIHRSLFKYNAMQKKAIPTQKIKKTTSKKYTRKLS